MMDMLNRNDHNLLLIWVDANVQTDQIDFPHVSQRFQNVSECIEFLKIVDQEKVFVITSGSLGQELVPEIHSMDQIESIFIFCQNVLYHRQWSSQWSKIRDVFNSIESFQHIVKQIHENSTPFSLIQSSTTDLNRLEPSFMYTQLFKKILLEMKHETKAQKSLVKLCRKIFEKNPRELKLIDEFARNYDRKKAIWWYTRECFTYQILNRALRCLQGDVIVDMGFFIHDLHRQIEKLHCEQVKKYNDKAFLLYRGQGLCIDEFKRLRETQGGLISFNSFLSTSQQQGVSLIFAERALRQENMFGVLFTMHIDPKIKSTPFADIQKQSYFHGEAEILFSMHTVFRIGQIRALNEENRLFEIQLTLTGDDDPDLHILADRIDEEIGHGSDYHRLGRLLIEMNEMSKAEDLYLELLERNPNKFNQRLYYQCLGFIKNQQGDYQKAIVHYREAIVLGEKLLSLTDNELVKCYTGIGSVYDNLGDYGKALTYHEKALSIREKTLCKDHPDLATSYDNVGLIHNRMGEYTKALVQYQKGLDIREKNLPENHPSLATSFCNIGLTYNHTGEYSKALSYYAKAVDIREKTLPANHPHLANAYSHMGLVSSNMGHYVEALSYYEKDLVICKKSLSADHTDLGTSYCNIGLAYNNMGEYSKALSYYEKGLIIYQKSLPSDHSLFATSYCNMGLIHNNMTEYLKALSYYEKAHKIYEKNFSTNHPDLATSYNNMGSTYERMGNYHQALSNYEQALSIYEKCLPADHPHFATLYCNIGLVYNTMGDFSKALVYYEKDLAICVKSLPSNHPDLATSYSNIGFVYFNRGNYSEALIWFQKALDIRQHILPETHPDLKQSLHWITLIKEKVAEITRD